MPFLLIAALLIAAIASPLAAADTTPPRQLPRYADTHAAPITPRGGFPQLQKTAANQPATAGRPAGHAVALPVAAASAPVAANTNAAHTDTAHTDTDTVTPQGPTSDASIRLTPRKRDAAGALGQGDTPQSPDDERQRGRTTWIATTVGGLGIALGAFLLLAWLFKRSAPAGLRPLPSEAVEVLGRAALSGSQQLHMLRFANKLVLISTTPSGDTISLAEIEDPDEVNRVVALCRQHDSQSSSESFRQLLQQFGQEPAAAGFVDAAGARPDATSAHSRGDRTARGTT